jgi:hypothetical protein
VGCSKGALLPVTDQPDMAACEIDLIIPVRSVQKCALVCFDAWNSRPLPVVQDTRRVDEDITVVGDSSVAREIFDMNIIPALLFIPVCARHLVLCLDVLV